MRIQTFSIVVGTRACNAHCPFCISHMTGFDEIPTRGAIYKPNFQSACRLAQLCQTTTVLMTGKGEPTLYPEEITEYLKLLQPWGFPLIELQTNALDIGRIAAGNDGSRGNKRLTAEVLKQWRALGLNTIAISVVSEKPEHNAEVYLGQTHTGYPDLATTIRFLHKLEFTVRLCVMMQKGVVDRPSRVNEIIDFCRATEVDQLTLRPIRKTAVPSKDDTISRYVESRGLDEDEIGMIRTFVESCGTRLMSLMHGAMVYDIGGQNVCLSDCLTLDPGNDDIRTLIFYSDGRLAHDWQYPGATILRGVSPEARAAQASRRMTIVP